MQDIKFTAQQAVFQATLRISEATPGPGHLLRSKNVRSSVMIWPDPKTRRHPCLPILSPTGNGQSLNKVLVSSRGVWLCQVRPQTRGHRVSDYFRLDLKAGKTVGGCLCFRLVLKWPGTGVWVGPCLLVSLHRVLVVLDPPFQCKEKPLGEAFHSHEAPVTIRVQLTGICVRVCMCVCVICHLCHRFS